MHISSKIDGFAVCDQPREKLVDRGSASLTNTELLAIIIKSGTHEESVMELSSHIMEDCRNSFRELSHYGVKELINKYKGIGLAKAVEIVAFSEIVRRSRFEQASEVSVISSSRSVFEFFASLLDGLDYEEFWVLFLNRSNKVIKHECLSKGGMSGTVIDIRILFRMALENRASSIIVCHNHPSGNRMPSSADKKITEKIFKAGEFMDIHLLDHVIVAENSFFSFADEGLIF